MYYEIGDDLVIDKDVRKWQIWIMPGDKKVTAYPQSQTCALFIDSAFLLVSDCLRQDDSAYFEQIRLSHFQSVAKHQDLVKYKKFCWT